MHIVSRLHAVKKQKHSNPRLRAYAICGWPWTYSRTLSQEGCPSQQRILEIAIQLDSGCPGLACLWKMQAAVDASGSPDACLRPQEAWEMKCNPDKKGLHRCVSHSFLSYPNLHAGQWSLWIEQFSHFHPISPTAGYNIIDDDLHACLLQNACL